MTPNTEKPSVLGVTGETTAVDAVNLAGAARAVGQEVHPSWFRSSPNSAWILLSRSCLSASLRA